MNTFRKFNKIIKDEKPLKRLFMVFVINFPLDFLNYFKIKINIQDYEIYLNKSSLSLAFFYNPNDRIADYKFITNYLRNGDTYIDIGANIGTTFIPAAKIVGPKGSTIAFEANPKIFQKLNKNIKLNNIISNSVTYNIAVGNNNSQILISDKKSDDTNNVINNGKGIYVPIKKLDDFLTNVNKINLLKIDVEGYEKFVFEGANEKIIPLTSCIYVEISEQNFEFYNYTIKEFLKIIVCNDFKIFAIINSNTIKPISINFTPKTHHVNIVCIRDLDDFASRTGIIIC